MEVSKFIGALVVASGGAVAAAAATPTASAKVAVRSKALIRSTNENRAVGKLSKFMWQGIQFAKDFLVTRRRALF